MVTRTQTVHWRLLSFAVAALLLSSSVFAAPAARVEFAIGNVAVVATDGRVRALVKGASVDAGETVNTNEGRAQLRFTDDGFVSLYTGTVFRIDQYRWNGVNNGSESSFFSLIKGGLRTVTGQLAKHNRKAYLMTTTLATVGIRGTEYTLQLNGGLSGSVAEGEIEVCNAGGCLAVAAGLSYFVPDASTKPVFSNKQTNLAPPQSVGGTVLVDGVVGGTTGTVNGLLGAAGGLLDTTTSGALTTLDAVASGLLNTSPAGGLVGITTGAVTGGGAATATGAPATIPGAITGTNPLLGIINLGF